MAEELKENTTAEETTSVDTAAVQEKPKKKKGPEYQSNEYSVWRYIIFLIVGFGAGQLIGGAIAYMIVPIIPIFFDGAIFGSIRQSAIIIVGFTVNFFFALLMIKPILHTSFKSLVTGNRKYKVTFGLVCIAIYIVVSIVFMLIQSQYISPNPADIGTKLACLAFVILLAPFQTTAEELFFRMSLGRLFMKNEIMKSVPKMLLASLISGLIFFVPHLTNPEVRAYGIVAAIFSYFGAGFSLMLISCIIGSFEGAIAVHAINNVWAMAVSSEEVSAASFSPFFIDFSNNPTMQCVRGAVLYALLILWAIIYRKKHKLAEAV